MQKKLYLCSEFMEKKTILHIIEWGVAIAACGFLIWKIATYDDYASLWTTLCAMGWQQWLAISICVVLMPVNMALEAWRWKTLVPMSWREAHRQVYYSKLAGLITPWRLGEYPARGLLMDEGVTPQVLSMGVVGSATMTAAIVIAGVCALAFSPSVLPYLGDSYLYALVVVVVVLGALYLLMPKMLRKWADVNTNLLVRSTAQSLVRLACWCIQLALVLYALGGLESEWISGLVAKTPIYYLLVTITPNVPVVEAGVRGAWAIVVFGTMNAALAGVLLWMINTLLPCISWFFIRKNTTNLHN